MKTVIFYIQLEYDDDFIIIPQWHCIFKEILLKMVTVIQLIQASASKLRLFKL